MIINKRITLILSLLLLFIISGCIDKPLAQAEKIGWNQTKYENYSKFYTDIVKQVERGAVPSPYSVEDVMVELHPDKDEFNKLWYQAFINMKRGLEARMKIRNSDCNPAELGGTTGEFSQHAQYCVNLYQTSMQSSEMYFQKSAEHRLIIEDLNPYNPIPKRVTLNKGQRNFTTIQGAIYAANEGDIISVGEGKYAETLLIKKSGISIIGANKEKVIIENNGIRIESVNNVTVNGFTIQQSNESDKDFFGIILRSANNITVTNMIIMNKPSGIILDSSHNNTVSDNDIKSSSRFGIHLSQSYDNKIYNNNIQNSKVGVFGWQARGNQLYLNNFVGNSDDGFWNSSATYPKNITSTIGIDLVLIPVGEFDMGSSEKLSYIDNEEPVHHVKLVKAFYMSKYEVTQKQWYEIMGNNPSNFTGSELPVESVSWNEVQEFIKKLNEKENTHKYRLPSEAEWEYATRAGNATRYTFGGDESKSKLGDYAWYDENSGRKTHPIGQKKPNIWGLYDIHGNVWEWVQDKYQSTYIGAPIDGTAWESGVSTNRVVRGGGWYNNAMGIRSAIRSAYNPDYHSSNLGFRIVRDV